jgi:hypothetical protein
MATVRAVGVKRGGEMAGKNPKDPDPDRYMQHAIVVFVSFTLDDFFHHCLSGFGIIGF